jgi:hypothetical protein
MTGVPIFHIIFCAFICSIVSSGGTRIAQWYSVGLRAGLSGVRIPAGLGISLITTASRTALGPTQPPIKYVTEAPSMDVKRPGREADHFPPSSVEVQNAWRYTSVPPIRLHGAVLS